MYSKGRMQSGMQLRIDSPLDYQPPSKRPLISASRIEVDPFWEVAFGGAVCDMWGNPMIILPTAGIKEA